MNTRLSAVALMFGNIVVGVAVLAPAGMIGDLASGLSVSIREAGLLIAYGAIVLCVDSPLMAWATSNIDRRMLLAVTLALLAAGQLASALAPDYFTVLAFRLLMLVVAAIYTPQAASTIAMIVPEKDRASAISFVFLGWSLSVAVALPLVTFLSAHIGWRGTFAVLGATAALGCLLNFYGLPGGLRGTPLSIASWAKIVRSPAITLLLVITLCWTAGMFAIFPYLAPLLEQLAGAGKGASGLFFALYGLMGFLGNVAATRAVRNLGAFNTTALSLGSMFGGTLVWSLGAGTLGLMAAGMCMLGLGFAATNSMQQARLVAAAPALSAATVALNTSWLYVGQALGSWLGGVLFDRGLPLANGYVAAALMLAGLMTLAATRKAP
jgi:MFS transporter, DHA1 family, inner membrane transport protein